MEQKSPSLVAPAALEVTHFRPAVRRLDRLRQRWWATRASLGLAVRRDGVERQRPRS